MQIRDYSLPNGWYPRNSDEICAFLSEFDTLKRSCRAAIAPHAGWYYCGHIAALGVGSLQPEADTVVVLGGHLPAGTPALFAVEDAVRTPFGHMLIDSELCNILMKELNGLQDRYRDNTVEVLLPMVHCFFPKVKLLWLRLPAEIESFKAGQIISQVSLELNRKVNVLASADLTHYGRNYGFAPQGTGKAALKWVRDVNDATIIKAIESGNSKEVLRCTEKDSSSCSAGALLGVMGFAESENLGNAQLLKYATSADIDKGEGIPDSFVGYAALAFNS